MLGIGIIIIWGNHFRHNSHQTAILQSFLHFACVYIRICVICVYNHVHICLYRVFWWDGVKFGQEKNFGKVLSNYLYIPNYNIFFNLNYLVLCFFPYQT